jgi:hypothetical protein
VSEKIATGVAIEGTLQVNVPFVPFVPLLLLAFCTTRI